jgi:hypothetical protein
MLITSQLLNDEDGQNCIVNHVKHYTIAERNKQPELLGGLTLEVISGPHRDFDVPVYCVRILQLPHTTSDIVCMNMFFNAFSPGIWTYSKIFVTPRPHAVAEIQPQVEEP